MFVYTPNSVVIPSELQIKRAFPDQSAMSAGRKINEAGKYDTLPPLSFIIADADTRTVFFDVFFDQNSRSLLGIGPLLLNLKVEIFPMRLFVNGKQTAYKIRKIHRRENLIILKSKRLNQPLPTSVRVDMAFNGFSQSIDLNLEHQHQTHQIYGCDPLTISTLQKDSEICNLNDWILWHRRLHGITRFIVYDNGSDNRTELIAHMKLMDPEVKVIFVDWSFPFSSSANRTTQIGSLNHCRLRFPVSGGYCINLDIDEYLASPDRLNLLEYLESNLNNQILPTCKIIECKVPNIADSKRTTTSRIFDFRYRFKKLGHYIDKEDSFAYAKYIYCFGGPDYLNIHYAKTTARKFLKQNFNAISLVQYFRERLRWIFFRYELKQKKRSDKSILLPEFGCWYVKESEFIFFHCLGIGKNWKNLPLKYRVNYDPEMHVYEPLILELCKEASLK